MSLKSILQTFDDEKDVIQVAPNKYVEVDKDTISLKGILQRKRLKLSRETAPYRKGVSFAPHAITYPFCRRMKIGQLAGIVDMYYDKARPSQQVGFDIGTNLHNMIQGYFWDVGMLKGTFECLKCDKSYHDTLAPTECPSGKKTHKKKHLRYREVTASNAEYSLYGRSDGILEIEAEDECLEIKSLPVKPYKNHNDYQFYFESLAVSGPRENHIIQLQFYLFMLQIKRGHLLYIAKNDGRIKTYPIEYDKEILKPYLNEISHLKDQAARLAKGENIDLPPCCADEKCACHAIIAPLVLN